MNKKYEVRIECKNEKSFDHGRIEQFISFEEARKFIKNYIFFSIEITNDDSHFFKCIKDDKGFIKGYKIEERCGGWKEYKIKEIKEIKKDEITEFLIQIKDKKLWLEKDIHTKTWKITKCPEKLNIQSVIDREVYGFIEEEAFGKLIDLLNFINEME